MEPLIFQNLQEAEAAFHKYWGAHLNLTEAQKCAVENVLLGKNQLIMLPTGAGKSVCYQLPALGLKGFTLVISPLIALMADQVNALHKKRIPAIMLHAGLPYKQVEEQLETISSGWPKLVFCSPERLQNERFKEFIQYQEIAAIAIDEAHCIAEWGAEFRPAYMKIGEFIQNLPKRVPVLALTASAPKEVQHTIVKSLGFKAYETITGEFSRPNLSLNTLLEYDKLNRVLVSLRKINGQAIIYVPERKQTIKWATDLEAAGISTAIYHGGLSKTDREQYFYQFMTAQVRVMIATNAFGMGIDKADVRLVIHTEPSISLEGYYQEAGRAGRDRKKAYALMLYTPADFLSLKAKVEKSELLADEVRRAYRAISSYLQIPEGGGEDVDYPFNFQEFNARFNFKSSESLQLLRRLEQMGYIALSDSFTKKASLKILMNNMDVYAFQVANYSTAPVIQYLMNVSGGKIFNQFFEFDELEAASALKMSLENLRNILKFCNNQNVLSYSAGGTHHYLTMLTPRWNVERLPLHTQRFELLKQNALKKIRAVEAFVQVNACKEKAVLAYFGIEKLENCGICSHCRTEMAKENKPNTALKLQNLKQTIMEMIMSDGALPPEEINRRLQKPLELSAAIQSLVEEEAVYYQKGLIFLKQGR